jgi:hypothetical protein
MNSPSQRVSKANRRIPLALIVIGGLGLAFTGKDGSIIGWLSLFLFAGGLLMFIGRLRGRR